MLSIPTDRMSGRRSSSITCRSLVGRRTSSYITSNSSDPFKVSFFFCLFVFFTLHLLGLEDLHYKFMGVPEIIFYKAYKSLRDIKFQPI